jgi:hypothetical protein
LAELHHRKSTLVIERCITVDLTNARARARDIVNQNVSTAAALLDTLLSPSTDEVDKLYHELKDILSIAATPQVESSLQRRAEVSIMSPSLCCSKAS